MASSRQKTRGSAGAEEEAVIELQDVWKAFGDHQLLRGLNLRIIKDVTTVIAGQCGSGKSVLLKIMMGLLAPDRGRVLLFGRDVAEMSEVELTAVRRRMGMVFQNYALFDSLDVAENIGFFLSENTRTARTELDARVAALLERFELPHAGRKFPAELSGGMRKRVSLARALISRPDVLLIDEPTTGLDPVMTERVTQMLLEIRQEFQMTGVIISHDMNSALRLGHRLAIMADHKVVAYGTGDEVRRSEHPVVKAFFATSGPRQVTARGEEPPAGDGDGGPEKSPESSVVQLRGVHKSFGEHHVLKGVELDIRPKKTTVIIGGSGSGKSVIIKHIMGLLKPDEGEVRLFGTDIARMSDSQLAPMRSRFGMLFQGAALLDSLTVAENVAFPLVERMGVAPRKARERVMAMLEDVNIPGIADAYPSEISNGQRKRVGLARAMITRPEIIIYDEPTTGQDPVMTRHVDDMIVEAQEKFDVTSIVISHDMPSAFRIGHEIAMLHEGRIIISGPPEAVAECDDPRVRTFVYAGTD